MYKTRHDWVGNMLYRESCENFNFDHTNKCNLHNPEYVQDNKVHTILWNLEIQTYHIISARGQELVTVNNKKRTCRKVDFAVPVDQSEKLEES